MAIWSKKNPGKGYYLCNSCAESGKGGVKPEGSSQKLKPTPPSHRCNYPHERYKDHDRTYACECTICKPANSAVEELDEMLEGLDEVVRGKRCPVCETSIHNCTCEDAKCESCGDPFQKDNERCPAFPNFHAYECCEEAADDHPHIGCVSGDHPAPSVVEGGWYDCGDIADGLCEDHEMCADHCPIQNGEEGCDHRWKLQDYLPHHVGDFSACADCRSCGIHGHITIDTDEIEID